MQENDRVSLPGVNVGHLRVQYGNTLSIRDVLSGYGGMAHFNVSFERLRHHGRGNEIASTPL
jgi:hypothetical protein